ncbi:hypothetical protein [Streptomyces sp. NBC_00233]|uniref:hypothetical protein n=1 Tax=Streptomyces sp. NBC_00233 TaxID=2975686 RepID=UPI00225C168E|nr:hypothetical protein [Streptomyces sp. NBC_00233]MCX5231497.1 hypothetical protein [Streptomyces sp. NBC_00233]MCX5233171.1 hypothetical protein [Streptomyces sp. NBC_00233]MCX5233612.1 hypothetical protein [Streptomyces sp. NBC_00233]
MRAGPFWRRLSAVTLTIAASLSGTQSAYAASPSYYYVEVEFQGFNFDWVDDSGYFEDHVAEALGRYHVGTNTGYPEFEQWRSFGQDAYWRDPTCEDGESNKGCELLGQKNLYPNGVSGGPSATNGNYKFADIDTCASQVKPGGSHDYACRTWDNKPNPYQKKSNNKLLLQVWPGNTATVEVEMIDDDETSSPDPLCHVKSSKLLDRGTLDYLNWPGRSSTTYMTGGGYGTAAQCNVWVTYRVVDSV